MSNIFDEDASPEFVEPEAFFEPEPPQADAERTTTAVRTNIRAKASFIVRPPREDVELNRGASVPAGAGKRDRLAQDAASSGRWRMDVVPAHRVKRSGAQPFPTGKPMRGVL
jgi:hypothetical protein